jgi:hypothetical protein
MNSVYPLVTGLFGINLSQLQNENLYKEQFEEWFSGFVDAEGTFQAFLDRHYVRV